jgi:hypothetical protein
MGSSGRWRRGQAGTGGGGHRHSSCRGKRRQRGSSRGFTVAGGSARCRGRPLEEVQGARGIFSAAWVVALAGGRGARGAVRWRWGTKVACSIAIGLDTEASSGEVGHGSSRTWGDSENRGAVGNWWAARLEKRRRVAMVRWQQLQARARSLWSVMGARVHGRPFGRMGLGPLQAGVGHTVAVCWAR